MPIVSTPAWVKDAVFYQIFPDRFATSPKINKPNNLEPWSSPPTPFGFKGGDLSGIEEHLDYLVDLGINAIYLNPIFQSASNHRYHTHDYYQVDPILGGDRAFFSLLEAAHKNQIKIILDGVFNHASRGFFQFNHILETEASSPYLDWFFVKGFPLNAYYGKPNYTAWANLAALPKFNTNNPQVREFIFGVAQYWLEKGIDGWRLDVPFEIDDDQFWQEFRQVVKQTNPEAYIVGEIPWEAQRWLQGDQFDAVMNYQFTRACLGFFAGEAINRSVEAGMMGFESTPVMDASAFASRAERLLTLYPREISLAQLNLLDSHDMPRFLTLANGNKSAFRLATLFQMTYPGAPCIYYGDEIGLEGGKDPDCRRAFPWSQSQWDTDLLNYTMKCVALRKAHPALRRGDFTPLYAKESLFIYQCTLGSEAVITTINNGKTAFSLDLTIEAKDIKPGTWQAIMGKGQLTIAGDHLFGPTLPPFSGSVFLCP